MSDLTNLLGAFCIGAGDLQNGAMVEAVGADLTTVAALLCIYARPGSSVGDIAAATSVTHSGAVRVVDRLVVLGLVKRRQGPADRRIATLSCTPAGSKVAAHALDARRAALDGLLATALPKKTDRQVALGIFERLLSSLHPQTRAEAWRICRLCEHAVCIGDECPVGRSVP